MSVDHSTVVKGGDAKLLHVRPGHFVIVGGEETAKGDWWMGQVMTRVHLDGYGGLELAGRHSCYNFLVKRGDHVHVLKVSSDQRPTRWCIHPI